MIRREKWENCDAKERYFGWESEMEGETERENVGKTIISLEVLR